MDFNKKNIKVFLEIKKTEFLFHFLKENIKQYLFNFNDLANYINL